MAKKFVRGITDIKNIEHQDFDTNNVNDLLSDGKHNYIHRKKQDGSEEYHNLTNNIKTIQSDNTDLLTVTNYNNTNNSATIRPKHDSQKEQLLESTDDTILIEHGENATDETTTVDVNFEKVQEKLTTGKGLSLKNNILNLEFSNVSEQDANNLVKGNYFGGNIANAPSDDWYWISNNVCDREAGSYLLQIATKLAFDSNDKIKTYVRTYRINAWSAWRELVTDKEEITSLLSQKQNTLTSNASIGVSGTGLMQLYSYEMSYMVTSSVTEGSLNTYAKTVKKNTLTADAKLEYHFTAKLNEGHSSITIQLNNNDKNYFSYILIKYGQQSGSTQTAMINGFVFSLSGSNLTITRDSSTYSQVVSFSDIIDPSQSVE